MTTKNAITTNTLDGCMICGELSLPRITQEIPHRPRAAICVGCVERFARYLIHTGRMRRINVRPGTLYAGKRITWE